MDHNQIWCVSWHFVYTEIPKDRSKYVHADISTAYEQQTDLVWCYRLMLLHCAIPRESCHENNANEGGLSTITSPHNQQSCVVGKSHNNHTQKWGPCVCTQMMYQIGTLTMNLSIVVPVLLQMSSTPRDLTISSASRWSVLEHMKLMLLNWPSIIIWSRNRWPSRSYNTPTQQQYAVHDTTSMYIHVTSCQTVKRKKT